MGQQPKHNASPLCDRGANDVHQPSHGGALFSQHHIQRKIKEHMNALWLAVLPQVDANKITAVDYAVYIEGLPKTAARKDIGEFFRYVKLCGVPLFG